MKRLLTLLILTFILVLTACQTPQNSSVESACKASIDDFQNTPATDVFETAGLKRTSATLTGYFDTLLSLTLYTDASVNTNEILTCVEKIYQHVHQLATNYDAFEGIMNVYQMNQNPGMRYDIDPLLADIIRLGLEYGELTDGLFDISLGPLINIWSDAMTTCNEGGVCDIPSEEQLLEASNLIGNQRIRLDGITFQALEGTQIDLGGVAKGYAAALVGDYLRFRGDVKGFLINAGTSNIEVYGLHPTRDNERWLIALRHPEWPDRVLRFADFSSFPSLFDDQKPMKRVLYFAENSNKTYIWTGVDYKEINESYARLFLDSGEHIVTAGDYQRFFEVGGVMFHHILDPRTLFPGQTMRSITLVGPDGVLGDVLSTAAFLMEPLDAITFVESHGFEAILYTLDGRILYSESIRLRMDEIHE